MDKKQAIEKAKEIRKKTGGFIFGFPISEDDPFSEYAVVVYAGSKYHVYPKASDISLAATGIVTIIEEFRKIGTKVKFEKDVRLVSYDAQINAPDVTMRRLRNGNGNYLKHI